MPWTGGLEPPNASETKGRSSPRSGGLFAHQRHAARDHAVEQQEPEHAADERVDVGRVESASPPLTATPNRNQVIFDPGEQGEARHRQSDQAEPGVEDEPGERRRQEGGDAVQLRRPTDARQYRNKGEEE